jgi:hypothetical protein
MKKDLLELEIIFTFAANLRKPITMNNVILIAVSLYAKAFCAFRRGCCAQTGVFLNPTRSHSIPLDPDPIRVSERPSFVPACPYCVKIRMNFVKIHANFEKMRTHFPCLALLPAGKHPN